MTVPWLGIVALVLTGLVSGLFLLSPHAFHEMDWNDSGSVSPAEVFRSLDIGNRLVIVDDLPCMEYFSLKDASIVRIDCSF